MKYIKILMFAGILSAASACTTDEISSDSIFKNKETVQTDFDKWLMTNFTDPYNIQFNYRYIDKLSDNYYNVVPADEAKSKVIAQLVKHVWLDAYKEVAGEPFMKQNCFRVMQLIGSPEYDGQNKIVLGTAEGGLKILLFRINELDPTNIYVNQDNPYANKRSKPLDLNHWYFHTMHHEFSHILHQKKSYSTEYRTISAGKYHAADWVNVKDEDAAADGFVTGYGSSEPNEDFAELYSTYVTYTDEAWQNILDHGVVVKKDASGAVIYARDKNGDYVYQKDAKGNRILETDANGDLIPVTDANGNVVYATDKDGKYEFFKDEKGNRIPMYEIHQRLGVHYTMTDKGLTPYFIFKGNAYPLTVAAGEPVYQRTADGEIVYDKDGNPQPEYFRVPQFEYLKQPEVDTFGRDAILKKLAIMKSYFQESWGIDLDKLRSVVLRRSKEASTLDLKTLK